MTLLLIVGVAVIAFVALLVAFARLDCDLTLWLADAFGNRISSLKGKVVWITGSSSGIGESLAYELAKAGCKLILTARNATRLDDVKQECLLKSNGILSDEDIIVVPFDIGHTDSHGEHVDTVLNHFGTIDILVNNAGRSQRAKFEDISLQVDRDMFDVNVFGLVNLTRIVLRHWLSGKRKGHVVVTSSAAGKFGVTNSATYTATKHALHGYFECLRNEAQVHGISVSIACPGPVVSNILPNAFTGQAGESVGRTHDENAKRMSSERCGHLMAVMIANGLAESWISIQPPLTLYYIAQYMPSISQWLAPRLLTPDRMAKLREGK